MQESAIPEDTTKDPQLLSRHDRYGDAKVKETVIEVRVVSEGGKRGVVEFRLPDDRVAAAAVHIRREPWEKPAGD
jgi:hypothetical protein